MRRELLVDSNAGELRAALVEDGTLVDVQIERRTRGSLVGNIYRGRVARIVRGVGAAFVELGLERAGFLPLQGPRGGEVQDEAPADQPALTEGEAVCVQVTRDPIGDKGAQLSRRLALAGRYLVYTPDRDRIAVSHRIVNEEERARLTAIAAVLAGDGDGFILRTAAEGATEEALAADAAALRRLWRDRIAPLRDSAPVPSALHVEPDAVQRLLRDHDLAALDAARFSDPAALAAARAFCAAYEPALAERLELHRETVPLFEAAGVEEAIEGAMVRHVPLPSGGGLVIDPTEALTAIDVNSGRYTGGSAPGDGALTTNLEAAVEIARQLRLRDIGGLVVIDFIELADEAGWDRVTAALAGGLARDRARARVVGRTAGGLVEVIRRRQRESLAQIVAEPCTVCRGEGRLRSAESVALDILRALRREAATAPGGGLTVTASVPVIAALRRMQGEENIDLCGSPARAVTLRAEAGRGRADYDIRVD